VIFPFSTLTEAYLMTLWIVTTPGWLVNPIPHGYYLAGAFVAGVAAGVLCLWWRGAFGASRGVDAPQPRGDTMRKQ
jgi:hypothetical protein